MWRCASITTRWCSCAKSSTAPPIKATVSKLRGWPACRNRCWAAPRKFSPTWKKQTSLPPAPPLEDSAEKKKNQEEEGYESFKVTSPANDSVIRDNGGNVRVSLSISPGLRSGHQIDVMVDGQSVGTVILPTDASAEQLVDSGSPFVWD